MSRGSPQSGTMERSLANLSLGSSSGSSGNQPPIRKADLAYNHVRFIARPGECKVWKRKIDVICNYLRINAPPKLQAHSYRIEIRTKQRNGRDELVIKREKAEPLFWSFYQQNRALFPSALNRIVFDGVTNIYSLDPLKIRDGKVDIEFPVSPNASQGRGSSRDPPKAKASVIVLPMLKIEDYFSIDEANRTALIQLLDLVISQEMRCPLVANASRFIVDGRSLFKVPTTDKEKALCVQRIGMGEEVWTGLHMAVKADAPDQLYLNVDTSTSIFYTSKLRLVEFYAQVMHGYTIPKDLQCDGLTITRDNTRKLAGILRGTKVRVLLSNNTEKVKKFENITDTPATALHFDYEDTRDGRKVKMSVAQYYAQVRGIRLQFPNLPCLMFTRKATRDQGAQTTYFPLEVCYTIDEPRKFKGKLTDTQLNAFIKAAGMGPQQKRRLIDTLAATNGSYLGQGRFMNEWDVEVDRDMVEIKDATVLPYPDIQWKDCITRVNEITAEYSITDDATHPRKLIETGPKPLAVVVVFVNGTGCKEMLDPQSRMSSNQFDAEQRRVYDREYRVNTEFFVSTLRAYGLEVQGPAWTFQYLVDSNGNLNMKGTNEMIEHYQEKVKVLSAAQKKEFMPLFVFVFPRRNEKFYGCIKYKCDVEYGVLSQVVLARTFQKLNGNPISNSSGQNLLLKVLAKAGGAACRIDGNQFKNVGKMTSSSTLVLAIDVSHPSREERMQALVRAGATADHARAANRGRGRHEQLPTSRVAASTAFRGFAVGDVPRSVVAVVGNVDENQTKWGVSARIQRLGQEETVNLTDPFVKRIDEFLKKTGALPKHILIYRDGVSGSQFKKTLYEETEAMQLAFEKLSIPADKIPKISYIVAQKRHHTRFFASDPKQAIDKSGNPGGNTPPGLLIESTITSRNTFDFFIQSHYGNIGTAVPTHYTVLRDDWQPSQSFWQTVIFAHCFGNARCTRPLSLPIPLHYAHLAARRAKYHYDNYKEFEATEEYRRSTEEVVREEMELSAITPHENLRAINALFFA